MARHTTLYVDQYNNAFKAKTVKELKERLGYKTASRMYIDKDGKTFHCGYVIGPHWLAAYAPILKEV